MPEDDIEPRVSRLLHEVFAAHAALEGGPDLTRTRVAVAIRCAPMPCTISAISDATGLDRKTVRRHVRDLVASGDVGLVGRGYSPRLTVGGWRNFASRFISASSPWLRRVLRRIPEE